MKGRQGRRELQRDGRPEGMTHSCSTRRKCVQRGVSRESHQQTLRRSKSDLTRSKHSLARGKARGQGQGSRRLARWGWRQRASRRPWGHWARPGQRSVGHDHYYLDLRRLCSRRRPYSGPYETEESKTSTERDVKALERSGERREGGEGGGERNSALRQRDEDNGRRGDATTAAPLADTAPGRRA